MKTVATLVCPFCQAKQRVKMPTTYCQFFYECAVCHKVMRPKPGDCCAFCSYADTKCASKQAEGRAG
jgi:hypothetical protein